MMEKSVEGFHVRKEEGERTGVCNGNFGGHFKGVIKVIMDSFKFHALMKPRKLNLLKC